MALIVEDGSIVAGANSYITVDEYIEWADSRFGSRSTAPSCDSDAEALILRAMDYFDSQNFQGKKVISTQPLQWPRSWVVIDGYSVEADEIPEEVKRSIFELTYAEEIGEGMLSVIDRKVKKEKVASIEVEYSDGSSPRSIVSAVPSAMRKLLAVGSGGFMVSRA
jgi:hypothetical protein